jgi:outer membrane protein assembly factor BamC
MRLGRKGVVAAVVLLAGCSTTNELLEGKKVDYKSSGTLPSLEIPPDLTTPARDNRYLVPETGRGAATLSGFQAERAQQAKLGGTTTVLPAVERMRIERSGSQRWLVVQDNPEKLWPLVKDFWRENGFLISVEIPEAGVMETDWAENRAKLPQDWVRATIGKVLEQVYSTSERDKFRTRMERAGEGATEIYVSHRGMMEVYAGTESRANEPASKTVWQPRPPEPDLEAEFLRRLMVRLGAQQEQAKQMIASAAPQEARAAIRKGADGRERLAVFEPFDRAWRRVGLALDRVGFTVEDRDRQKGLYFVRYADPEAEMSRKDQDGGLLGKLAFWRSSDEKVKAEQYRVQVTAAKETSEVAVLNKDGAADNSASTRRILTLLHDQLK